MINKADIITWRKATAARLKEIGETDEQTLKPYDTKSTTISDSDFDLLALQQLEHEVVAAGFTDFRLADGKWWCNYNQILLRAFIEHKETADKQKQIGMTLVAKGFGDNPENLEVADWVATIKHDGDQIAAVVTQIHFDIATLVLPQK